MGVEEALIAAGALLFKLATFAINASAKSDEEKAALHAEATKIHAEFLEVVGGFPARMKDYEDKAREEVAKRFGATSTMGGTVEHLFNKDTK